MTKKQKEQLLKFMEDVSEHRGGFCSDSDIEDFCEEHHISLKQAYEFIDENRVPECCKGCKYVGMFDNMHPCDDCSRPREDMYEAKI